MNGALTDDDIIEHLRYLLDEGVVIIAQLLGEVDRETWRENDFIAEVYEFKKQYLKYRRKEAKDGGDAVRA